MRLAFGRLFFLFSPNQPCYLVDAVVECEADLKSFTPVPCEEGETLQYSMEFVVTKGPGDEP